MIKVWMSVEPALVAQRQSEGWTALRVTADGNTLMWKPFK